MSRPFFVRARVASRQLPRHVRHAYIVLASYADADGLCWPSNAELAADLDVHERTVRRCIVDLERHGCLEVIYRSGGRSVPSRYRVIIPDAAANAPESAPETRTPDAQTRTGDDHTRTSGVHTRTPDAQTRTPDARRPETRTPDARNPDIPRHGEESGRTSTDPGTSPTTGSSTYSTPFVRLDNPADVDRQRRFRPRAEWLVGRFRALYAEKRTGIYPISMNRERNDWLAALRLCEAFDDTELEILISYFLDIPDGASDEFEPRKTRTLEWCAGLAAAISRKLDLKGANR